MKIDPIADCKTFGFTRSNKTRKIKVEISLNNNFDDNDKAERVFALCLTLYRKDIDSNVYFSTDIHSIKESIFQNKEMAIKFAEVETQPLVDAFLKQKDYYEEIKKLHRKYTVKFIDDGYFEFSNKILFYKKYSCLQNLPLKIKPHNLRWLLQDIFEFREIDLSKRILLQTNFVADDMFNSLGISKHYQKEDIQFLHIQLKNDKTQYQEYIPGSDVALQRKNDGSNMFVIEENIKDAFKRDYAKFALVKRKVHILVIIDKNYNILQASIRY